MENLDWLAELIRHFPATPQRRKNLIEIAGYPSWENVNSNLLAFYFDEQEEHGFGRLFFTSLLDVLNEEFPEFDRNDFEAEDPVIAEREVYTQAGGRLDLLIKPTLTEEKETSDPTENPSWAILIENKIYHYLANSLEDYWASVDAKPKFGVVLSLHPVSPEDMKEETLADKGILFKNITHRHLAKKIKENLPEYFEKADDRHLLFLKDYLANIQSHYMTDTPNLDKTLALFHQEKSNIAKFKETDSQLLQYISRTIREIFKEYGFTPSKESDTSQAKHFYFSEEQDATHRAFRFYVYLGDIRYSNTFECTFELYEKANTRYGSEVKKLLEEKNIYTSEVQPGSGGSENAAYMHIYSIKFYLTGFENGGLKKILKQNLDQYFFEHPSIDFIKEACDALAQAKKKQQP